MSVNSSIYNKYYYQKASETSFDIKLNPGLKEFFKISKNSDFVLEMGCGEGSKLHQMSNKKNKLFGIDYSKEAIKIAKKKYPHINFSRQNIEKTNFDSDSFDFVYSSFVMEHTENPEKIIKEMIRITKKGGKIGILCPNFGSPIFRSPCNKENFIIRFFRIFIRDLLIKKSSNDKIIWDRVLPIATDKIYFPDWDTTIEPSLLTFIYYLNSINNIKIIKKSSQWELKGTTKPKKGLLYFPMLFVICFFSFLAKIKLYPFKYYGPQLFIILEKI